MVFQLVEISVENLFTIPRLFHNLPFPLPALTYATELPVVLFSYVPNPHILRPKGMILRGIPQKTINYQKTLFFLLIFKDKMLKYTCVQTQYIFYWEENYEDHHEDHFVGDSPRSDPCVRRRLSDPRARGDRACPQPDPQ